MNIPSFSGHIHSRFADFDLELEFKLPERGFTVIWGESGSGKTTFLRALAGLDRKVCGRIKFGEHLWLDDEWRMPAAKRQCSYIFQDGSLLPHMTVQENLDLALKYASQPRSDFQELLSAFGVTELLSRRASQLSGGQSQRVALLRSIIVGPKAILMDEPLSSLDRPARRNLLKIIRNLKEFSLPVVYVTHDRDELLTLADYVMVLQQGRLAFAGDLQATLEYLQVSADQEYAPVSVLTLPVIAYESSAQLLKLGFGSEVFYAPCDQTIPAGAQVRIVIYGRDVIVFPQAPGPMSALNVTSGKVTDIMALQGSQYLITVATAVGALRTLITGRSLGALGLAPGDQVWLAVKAVSVLV